ncbi:MAG: HupE/UreJ family protein [Verrucomicrobiota bacterium]
MGTIALFAQTATAHTPFESSARVTVFADHIEAALTSGTGLAATLLQETGIDPTQAKGFNGAKTSPSISQRIIRLETGGQSIPAEAVKVLGDGLETMLVVTFPRPADNQAIKLSANYSSHIPSGNVSPLVIVDEQGRMLGSHLVTSGNGDMEFQLTANLPTAVAANPNAITNAGQKALESTAITTPIPTPSFLEYLKLGIHHIVTGYDHLLFLCGLLVGCKRVGPILTIITCFTLAHSITLTLAALDVLVLSPRIVEPIIAASIIFVGIENFRRGDNVKARCWLAFGFGLIHGFGFAGPCAKPALAQTPARSPRHYSRSTSESNSDNWSSPQFFSAYSGNYAGSNPLRDTPHRLFPS